MVPFLQMMKDTPLGAILKEFIEEDCGFSVEDATKLQYYAETTRDREAEAKAGSDYRCFMSTGNSMYILTFANGAQHCKYVNAEMLEAARKVTV